MTKIEELKNVITCYNEIRGVADGVPVTAETDSMLTRWRREGGTVWKSVPKAWSIERHPQNDRVRIVKNIFVGGSVEAVTHFLQPGQLVQFVAGAIVGWSHAEDPARCRAD